MVFGIYTFEPDSLTHTCKMLKGVSLKDILVYILSLIDWLEKCELISLFPVLQPNLAPFILGFAFLWKISNMMVESLSWTNIRCIFLQIYRSTDRMCSVGFGRTWPPPHEKGNILMINISLSACQHAIITTADTVYQFIDSKAFNWWWYCYTPCDVLTLEYR